MKEQENFPKEELNEIMASNLSDTEFKVMLIWMLNIKKKDIETMKNNQAERKNNIPAKKNTLKRIISMMKQRTESAN